MLYTLKIGQNVWRACQRGCPYESEGGFVKYLCLILIFLFSLIFLSCGENSDEVNAPENNTPLDVRGLKAVELNEAVFLYWTEPEDIEEIKIEWERCGASGENQVDKNPASADKDDGKEEIRTCTQDCSDEDNCFGCWSNKSKTEPLENGVTYKFTVKTIDEDGNSSNGVSVHATPKKDAIQLLATAGNNSVYLEWTLPAVLPSKNKIEYFAVSNDEMAEETSEKNCISLEDSVTSYRVENLLNDINYCFIFYTEIYGKQYTSEKVFCTPSYFASNPDTKRAIAINCDGNTFLSWTYKSKSDFGGELQFPKSVRVYYKDTFVEELLPISVNEQMNPEQSNYEIDIYDKYFAYTVVSERYEDLAFRAVDENDIESNAFDLPEATEVSLPIVDIKTENLVPIGDGYESAKKEKKIPSTLSIFNCNDKERLECVSLTVKGRGNSSWENAPKKSYTLKFTDKQAILGMKKHKSYALVANYFDKTLLRNITAYELGRDVYQNMAWTPSAKSVHLFMNGIYEGIYAFTETNKIDKNRLNITNLEDYTEGDDFYKYGYLLEANDRADENFNFETNQNATKDKKLVFSLKEPDGEDITKDLWKKIKTEVLKREDALFSDDFSDEKSEHYWKTFFDEDSFIDWWIVSEFACNTDSNYFSSCYVYYEPTDKKFHAGPLWDFDFGFGNMRDLTSPEKSYTANGVWLKRMFEDASFKKKAGERWTETLNELDKYLQDNYNENLTALQNDVDVNFKRWPILGKNTWKSPSDVESRTTYQAEVDYFRKWCESRKLWLSEWLAKDTSVFSF